ncbi:hypothetical protein [Pseudarthrobacter sp. B4EP4b]|uniref:hypothetical protein n=1 Tax=Pseudarthrobacter sp. B4EP4b TaxID=2590664 RepID=UPI0011533EC8|nr:hypothetical protein [Pseudarthrobacter sp. B4EP4b]
MSSLTVHEVEQLVALRLSLEDALTRAKGATKYRRGTAIVALDATVERASSIVAVTRSLPIPKSGKLEDLISSLRESFGSSWKPAVLPDIRHLRRARNASQHEGLEPDREQVPLWASAANVYVSSLIDAQFDVDILTVALSDAIRDPRLRQFIREAETARAAGEPGSCVDKATEAYGEASTRWTRLRGDRRPAFAPTSSQLLDKKSHDFVNGRIDNVQSVLDAAAFSQDLAEAEWFTSAIAEPSEVMDADDAERVLAFAFEWIVEYERAAASWTPNRRHRAAVARRKVRSGAGPARIDSCVSVDFRYGTIRAIFSIADVPPEKDYSVWARTVQDLLAEGDLTSSWTVSDDGTIEVRRAVKAPSDTADEVEVLSSALKQADVVLNEKLQAAAKEDRLARQRRDEYAESLETVRADLPAWVEDIQWSDEGFGGGKTEQLLVTLAKDMWRLRFGERGEGSFYDNRTTIYDVIRNHELVDQCYGTGGRSDMGIMPVLNAEHLARVFKDADVVVSRQLEIERAKTDEQKAAVVAVKSRIAARLTELS